MRTLNGLVGARECQPVFAAPKRRKGAKARGIAYERALARALPQARHGQWFEYWDRRGKGHCQTDLLLEHDNAIVVLEAKYTWVAEGHVQVEQYCKIIEKLYAKQALGIVVCKVLTDDMPGNVKIASDLGEAITWALHGLNPVVLHWLGSGPVPFKGGRIMAHPMPDCTLTPQALGL